MTNHRGWWFRWQIQVTSGGSWRWLSVSGLPGTVILWSANVWRPHIPVTTLWGAFALPAVKNCDMWIMTQDEPQLLRVLLSGCLLTGRWRWLACDNWSTWSLVWELKVHKSLNIHPGNLPVYLAKKATMNKVERPNLSHPRPNPEITLYRSWLAPELGLKTQRKEKSHFVLRIKWKE